MDFRESKTTTLVTKHRVSLNEKDLAELIRNYPGAPELPKDLSDFHVYVIWWSEKLDIGNDCDLIVEWTRREERIE